MEQTTETKNNNNLEKACTVRSLLCVKSVVTVLVTIALCVLTYMYPDEYSETFKTAVTMVVTFYFSHQSQKK